MVRIVIYYRVPSSVLWHMVVYKNYPGRNVRVGDAGVVVYECGFVLMFVSVFVGGVSVGC